MKLVTPSAFFSVALLSRLSIGRMKNMMKEVEV